MGCVAELKDIPLEQLQQHTANEFVCPKCEYTQNSIRDEATWSQSLLETKARRLGINYETDWSNVSDRTKRRRLNGLSMRYTS